MDGIDSLKFNVILVDDQYKKEIDECVKQAQRLNSSLTEALSTVKAKKFVTDAGVRNSEKVAAAFERIRNAMANMPNGAGLFGDADALNRTLQQVNANLDKMVAKQGEVKQKTDESANAQKRMNDHAKQTNASLMSTSNILRLITQLTGVYFGAMGIRRFLSSMIEITGQFEVQRMALRNMLQDVDAADKIFHDLYRFSSDSTYRFSELAKYAKQLAAFNIDKSDLLETTKMLGDVASGVGVSMDRIILAYGHVKSSGFLRGIQLRSFSQNGVPVLEELSKILTEVEGKTVSLGDVFDKMTRRQIPFEMVEQAFKNMTSEGGKFYQMQEVLAKTLAGQINILKGRWENMLAAIGDSNQGILKGAVAKLNDLVLNYDKLGKLIGEMILVWGAYRAAIFATTLATEGLSAATNIGLLGAMKNVLRWVASNPWAILAATITFVTIEIVKATSALNDHEKLLKALSDVTKDYEKSLNAEIGELDALFSAVKNATEGTDEYAAAKRALESRFDPYIQKLREEGVEVNNLTALYDGLVTKITDYNKQRFLEDAQKDLTETFTGISNEVKKDLDKLIREKGGLTPDQKGALLHYVMTGEKSEFYDTIQGLNRGVRRTSVGAGGGSFSWLDDTTVQQRLDKMRDRMAEAGAVYAQQMADAAKMFDVAISATGGSAERELTGWRKRVKDITDGLGEDVLKETGLVQKEDEDYYDYLDRIGKKFKELREEEDKALKENKPLYKGYIDAIKQVDKALEGNILKDARYTREPWNGGSSGGSSDPFSKEITSTRARIAVLEKYKSAFDKLEAVFGEGAEAEFKKLFPNVDLKETDEELERLIAHLKTLGDSGKTAAESIEASLGLDEVSKAIKEYKAAQKSLDDYEKALAKFDKDWGTGDSTGAANKADKSLRRYTNEKKKIEDEWREFTEAAKKANKEVTKTEEDLYEARKKANDNNLFEDMRGLVDDIFKDKFNGKELSDWSHKTLSDIREIKSTVESMGIPPEIEAMVLESGGEGALSSLKEAFEAYKQALIDGTIDPEYFRKTSKYAKLVASYISKAGAAMKKLGDAYGDSHIADAGEALSAIGQNLNAAAEGFEKSGSWIGAVVGGVVDIFNQATEAVAKSKEKMKEMEDAIRNIRLEAEATRFDDMLSAGVDSIFGENFIRRIYDATNSINELKKSLPALEEARRSFVEWQKVLEIGPLTHGTSETIPNIIANLATPDIGDMLFRTEHSFWSGDTFARLSDIATEFGLELNDVNGNLNPKLLQQVLELYGDLNEGAKDWMTAAIQYSEEYAKALEQIEDATKDVFDNLASSMADQFIDNFLSMRDAVDDLSATFADLGDAILRSFLQSYILDEILGKYETEAKGMLSKYAEGGMTPDDYAAWLRGFADNVQRDSEVLAPAINGMIEAFKDRGLLNIDADTANSLGNGIKGITEDTANLLASYINAIRADVSYIRLMQETGWENIGALAGGLPTLNDYLAQIAANTFDTAQQAGRILTELQAVIGPPGTSGMVVRVEAY